MFLEFLFWWYGEGWASITKHVGHRVVAVWHLFSVVILIQTLFSPWKRIISPPAKSFDQIIRAMVDNTFSRAIGFCVRSFVLVSVTVFTAIAAVVGFLMVTVWPLLPAGIVYCVVRSVTS